jgi:hypothetical protein
MEEYYGKYYMCTFYNYKGCCLIDYVLTESQNFCTISDFSSGNFSTFFDHSPVSFKVKVSQSIVHGNRNSTGRAPCKSVKCIEENTPIDGKTDQLYNVIDTSLINVCDVSACVENFCTVINQCVLP